MLFTSLNFACFVLVVLLAYYVVPIKYRWVVLLLASYFFYSLVGVKYVAYILVTTSSVYILALLIEKISKKSSTYLKEHKDTLTKEEKKKFKATAKSKQRWLLFLCVFINAGLLLVLKYGDLALIYYNYYRNILTGSTEIMQLPGFILPLGISFYTLQAIGYIVDVYYGKCTAEKNFFRFALFISFFPQIMQGPISRFSDLSNQLMTGHQFNYINIKSGFTRIMWGLFKKLVIADRLSPFVTTSMDLAEFYPGPYVVLGVLLYGFQLYGDFSGGIDITIGVAEMLGIKLTENFERPFFSKNIAEYWRRWHISLGEWFKDYVFYPLSINKTVLKLGKKVRGINEGIGKRLPIYIPMLMVWTLTGMWHGSGMKYVCWGLLNCFFIILGTEFEPVSHKIMDRFELNENMFLVKFYRVTKTFMLLSLLRMFDICKSPKNVFENIRLMFTGWGGGISLDIMNDILNITRTDFIIAVCAIVILMIFDLYQRKGSVRKRIFALPSPVQWVIITTLILVVVIFGYYGYGYDAAAFVYMQF